MTQKKRVLLVHNYYQIGGGEHTVFENEKALLEKNGHEVYTYTRSNDELKTSKWKLLLLPFSTIWSVRTYFQVRKLIGQRNIEIVHCHNTFPLISPSVYYAARSRKVPVIQTIHNFRFLCPNGLFYCNGGICEKCKEQGSFLHAIKNGCYRDSKLQTVVVAAMLRIHRWLGTYRKINYIFLTEFNRDKFSDLIDIQEETVFIKQNFVCWQHVPESHKEVKTKFVYAGRLEQNKGVDFLLEAWRELPEEYELHIYGDGSLREACKAAADTNKNVHYFGFRPQQEILADLADSAALVFPSVLYETFGMSWAESFSMGRPVLAADLGNHGELVRKSQGGLTYACGSKSAFCDAAKKIVLHNERYSQNAMQYCNAYLNESGNYERLSEIYDKAKHI